MILLVFCFGQRSDRESEAIVLPATASALEFLLVLASQRLHAAGMAAEQYMIR